MSRSALWIPVICCLIAGVAEGQAPNDDCSMPTTIVSGTPEAFDTSVATQDGAVPSCGFGASTDVWYTWTADCTGTALITTCGTGYDTVISAYAPSAPCPPTAVDEIGCSDLGCGGVQSEMSFPCTMGTSYLIRVGGWDGASGPGILTAECVTAGVPNDDCATPAVLSNGVSEAYSTVAATIDGPAPTCGASDSNDIWYTWTAPVDGIGYVNTCGSTYDTNVTVYAPGTVCLPTNMDEIACSDLGCGGVESEAFFPCVGGTTYLIQVGGWNGAVGSGTVTATVLLDPVENLTCAPNVGNPLQVDVTWTLPASQAAGYAGAITVEVSGAATDTIILPGTATAASYTAPGGTMGQLDFCIVGDNGAGNASGQVCCSAGVGTALPNDNCSGAIPITDGVTENWDNTLATVDGPVPTCSTATPDLWYIYTASCDGDATIDTCNTTSGLDTVLVVYPAGVCPPAAGTQLACSDLGCGGLLSEVTLPVLSGESYLIQVGGWNGAQGTGSLDVSCNACGDIGVLACDYDCGGDVVSLAWTDNPLVTSYDVFENGILLANVAAGTSTFDVTMPTAGTNDYLVEGICSIGGTILDAACTTTVISPPGAGSDLILALERLNPNGPGDIDSAVGLEVALSGAGRTPVVFAVPDFDIYTCLDLTQYSVIWVMTGSFGNDYRPTSSELNLLASYVTGGGNLYFEGGDHWGFGPTASALDDIDGIDPGMTPDGDDTFTTMDGQNAATVGLDLSASAGSTYSQDDAGSDWTDQLSLAATDASVVAAESIWRNNDDDPALIEPDYITGVAATNTFGTAMISSSWEFGGYNLLPADPIASDPDRQALAEAYLSLLNPGMPMDSFRRGDCNQDTSFNIADAIYLLAALFSGGPAGTCSDACDVNDDGSVNIADAVYALATLFSGGPNPPAPGQGPDCGEDPTADMLDCATPCP